MSLTYISRAYTELLTPIPPFTWIGVPVSTLHLLATLRLCAVMRQLRELGSHGYEGKREEKSFMRDFLATFIVVYGGEAVTYPWVGQPPSFLLSPVAPLLYFGGQALVEWLPRISAMSFQTEGPLTFLDAMTRAWLLVDLIPPAILTHSNSAIAGSPWTLLVFSLITANGGFFIVNLFSIGHPGGWSLTTPAELKAYGWTTVDLWAAPLVTGLSALVTHAQPFWTHLHLAILGFSRPVDAQSLETDPVKPWSAEDARSLGALVLWVLFATRTFRTFGIAWWKTTSKKKEVMRSKVDGRRYPGTTKTKKIQ